MRWLLLIVTWTISSSVVYAPAKYPVFGVKVSIAPNSQITSYVCYLSDGRFLYNKRAVDKTTFVKFVSGHWPSIYNPKRVDYFAENDIDCGLIENEITRKMELACVPLDSLWKIRFATYPFRHNPERGWSNKYHRPSPGQEKYLHDRYSISQIDGDYFLDTNFWRLMHDVTNPLWIAHYKSIK